MIFCLELFGFFVTATPQSHLIEHRPETTFPVSVSAQHPCSPSKNFENT
jgi:hypothetical protein